MHLPCDLSLNPLLSISRSEKLTNSSILCLFTAVGTFSHWVELQLGIKLQQSLGIDQQKLKLKVSIKGPVLPIQKQFLIWILVFLFRQSSCATYCVWTTFNLL